MKVSKLLLLLLAMSLVLSLGLTGCGTSDGDSNGDSDNGSDDAVRVTLKWSEDVDLDLEIWNADGTELVARSFDHSGIDDAGTGGEEYFDFKDYGDGDDFSTGSYVISVFFADYGDDDDAGPHVTWTDEDGDPQERVTSMEYIGNDQWHVIQIDAETGNSSDIDEFVDYVTE
jgi:hypothetical protein